MKLYVVKLADGQYWKGSGYRGTTDKLEKAKVYASTGPARGAVSYHSLKGAVLVELTVAESKEIPT